MPASLPALIFHLLYFWRHNGLTSLGYRPGSPPPKLNRFGCVDARPRSAPSCTAPSSSSATLTMSLLRSCQRAVQRPILARATVAASRAYATDSNIPQAAEQKQDSEIAEAPPRDVVTADLVSGAPSMSAMLRVRLLKL